MHRRPRVGDLVSFDGEPRSLGVALAVTTDSTATAAPDLIWLTFDGEPSQLIHDLFYYVPVVVSFAGLVPL